MASEIVASLSPLVFCHANCLAKLAQWLLLQALNQLMLTYVASHPNSGVVLPRLWLLATSEVVAAMISLYNTDPTTISRTLEVCQVILEVPHTRP